MDNVWWWRNHMRRPQEGVKLGDSGLSGLLLDWELMLALMVGSELASTVALVVVLLLALMVGSEL